MYKNCTVKLLYDEKSRGVVRTLYGGNGETTLKRLYAPGLAIVCVRIHYYIHYV